MRLTAILALLGTFLAAPLACGADRATASLGLPLSIVAGQPAPRTAFPLVTPRHVAPLWYDTKDYPGVARAIGDLRADIERVTSRQPTQTTERPQDKQPVIIGTLGHSAVIDQLIATGKLDARDLKGKWESFVITTIAQPMPGMSQALVIAGSDKRGTIYGIYELSEQLGVSPWYWWADVPARRRAQAYIVPGRFASGEPAVRYRGIFLNDEAPCLSGWTAEKFGGMNSKFYTKVFELLLRLRGNYLWPAMWDNAFNEDDPENPRLADEYGIVMGTSHHEPMMRAHKEWRIHRNEYGNGEWNYASNSQGLQEFFRRGIERNQEYENLVTIGMRGDGDQAMPSTGSMQSDIQLLERVISDQRRILTEVTGRDAAQIPQLWALFTEVMGFYEHGMRVPDDVTLLWTDDNTGNLRRLPTPQERNRSGGAGIYYHLDMHGGPFAYQWINTNPLPKIAEQMTLAHEYGANRIWIANVGDLKPLEIPLEYFLRLAWNPAAWSRDQVGRYSRTWAEREFGPQHAAEIAGLASAYAKYNGWRKPELISPDTFSVTNYREAERVSEAWGRLVARAQKLYQVLPPEQRDAFYQLILHPVKASATVVEMNIAAGRNHLFARQGRASTNSEARRTRDLFEQDQALSEYYNHTLAGGKWDHLMDQTHLGQITWQPPRVNAMPAVSEVLPSTTGRFGVAIEGDPDAWPDHFGDAVLPTFDSLNPQRSCIEVFAQGTGQIDFAIHAEQPWIRLSEDPGPRLDRRFWVDIDWDQLPAGLSTGTVLVTGGQAPVRVKVPALKASDQQLHEAGGTFASLGGPIAIAAEEFTRNVAADGIRWEALPDYGRSAAAMSIFPVTAASRQPGAASATLEYPVFLGKPGRYEVTLILGPVMDFVPDRGMRIAVALDDAAPQVLDIFADRAAETFLSKHWELQFTRDNARYLRSTHEIATGGRHILKISMVDPGIVLEELIVSDGEMPDSYFGPPLSALQTSTERRCIRCGRE